MNEKLTEKLWNDFPLLYRGKDETIQTSLIPFGFPSSGWYSIIRNLSEKLEPIAREQYEKNKADPNTKCSHCGKKEQWHWLFFIYYAITSFFKNKKKAVSIVKDKKFPYLNRLSITDLIKWWWSYKWYRACKKFVVPHLHATQTKEKFSSLRYYVHDIPEDKHEEVNKLISEAESLSMKTCEYCGNPGKLQEGGWMKTLCDKCQETRYDKRNE